MLYNSPLGGVDTSLEQIDLWGVKQLNISWARKPDTNQQLVMYVLAELKQQNWL